jgi:hypothetical protein
MSVGQDKTVDELLEAREAYERRDWVLAFDRLRGVGDLGPEDSMALATSAYLVGNVDEAIRALQAGYQDKIRSGDSLGAVRFAFWLGLVLNLRGEPAVAGGWIARAQRLLENETQDVVERGYLLSHEFFQHLDRGDFARASETAARVVQTGRRFTEHDLIAMGLVMQGRMMIYSGRVPEGLALLDEAMVGVSAAEISPIVAGMVYCSMIEACQELSDFSRAAAWTSALTKWCDAQPGWFRTPVSARSIEARSCGCAGHMTRRLLNLRARSADTRRKVRRHLPGLRWRSRVMCCAFVASSMRQRRRTGSQPSSATSLSRAWPCHGSHAVG